MGCKKGYSVLVLILIILSCGKKSGNGGSIVVEPGEIKFGRVISGRGIDGSALIKNSGSTVLLVKSVRSNCECVVVEKYPQRIEPQAVDTLRFKFIAPNEKGETKKSIMIETSDKTKPLFTLDIFAYVEPSYMDSTLAVLNFQADDEKLGYELAVSVAEKAKSIPKVKLVRSDELVDRILSDPDYKKVETDKLVRKWGDSLGIRYVVTGQVKAMNEQKVTVVLVFIDAFFEHSIIRRIEGERRTIKDTVVAEFALTMENIDKVEKEVYIQALQSRWLKKRAEIVGKQAQGFKLKAVDGKDVLLEQFKGRVVILHFFSINCEACIEELEWMKANSSKPDCSVIGISVDEGREKDILRFIEEHSLKYPIVVVSERDSVFLNTYYTNVTPQTVIIDKSGIVRESMIGFSSGVKDNLDRLIDELIK